MSTQSDAADRRDSPYFGLDYYDEKWGRWFFGREGERNKVITNLRAARLTLLHADSGVGKSSLLRAGVAWRLQALARDNHARRGAPRYVPVVFSTWKDDPVVGLIAAIEQAISPFISDGSMPQLPRNGLVEAIQVAAQAVNGRLFVILDQFEEYFLYSAKEPTPEGFADELARCINAEDLPVNFLIAIREDAYAGLGDLFKGRIANVYGNYLTVDYLARAAADEAIRQPVRIYNEQPGVEPVEIEPGLVEAVLEQVKARGGGSDGTDAAVEGNGDRNDEGHVETPLLQLVMESVWNKETAGWTEEASSGPRVLHRSTLEELKGVERIVDTHLADALEALDQRERLIAIKLFDYLVTASGGKIAESVPDLASRTDYPEEDVRAVLAKLDRERIVRSVPPPPGQDAARFRRYEIFHDVLAPAINRVIAADKEERLEREKEEADVRAETERRRARRSRIVAGVALCLMVVAVVIGVIALREYQSAVSARHTAQSRQLAASADKTLSHDPQKSTALALKAVRLKRTSDAIDALRSALPADQQLRTFPVGTAVTSAAFDPADPNLVASASKDGIVSIWNVRTGHRVMRLVPGSGVAKAGAANVVSFNRAGTEVAVGYGRGRVSVFDVHSGKQVDSSPVGPGVQGVTFIGNGADVVLATENGAGLWRRQTGYSCCHWFQNNGNVASVSDNPRDPSKLVLAGVQGTYAVDLADLNHPRRRLLSADLALDATYSANGREVAVAGFDGKVTVLDAATAKTLMTIDVGEGTAYSVAMSPDGKRIAVAYADGTTRLWDVATKLTSSMFAADTGAVESARFNRDGSEVVTASDDGTIRVWYARPRGLQAEFYNPYVGATTTYSAQYNFTGSRILELNGLAYLFNANGTPVSSNGFPVSFDPAGAAATINSARFDHTGTEVITADGDGTVRLWRATGPNYTELSPRTPIRLPSGDAQYADFSQDGSRIVAVGGDNTAEVFDTATRRQVLPALNAHHGFAFKVAVFNPSGTRILTADRNGQVEVWDASNGHEIRVLGTPGAQINDVEFSRDGTRFVTAAGSGVVTIWDVRDYHATAINACSAPQTAAFNRRGTKIVVACSDGTTPIFAADSGQQLTVLRTAATGTINSAAFSPDGNSVVTAFSGSGGTGGVRIWSAALATMSLSALERLAEQATTG